MANTKQSIVVLGGGLAGLISTYRCSLQFPSAQVYLIEKEKALGGCIKSITHDNVVMDVGPHSIRMGKPSASLIALLQELDIGERFIRPAQGAGKRYIYQKGEMVELPGKLTDLLHFPRLLWALTKEPFKSKRTDKSDETVERFFERRLGKYFAKSMIDPMMFGIFACHMRELSVKSCFPIAPYLEKKYGSIVIGMFKDKAFMNTQYANPYKMDTNQELFNTYKDSAILNFKSGMATIADQLVLKLMLFSNVTIISNDAIKEVIISTSRSAHRHMVTTESGVTINPDIIVSALPAIKLHPLLKSCQEADLIDVTKLLQSITYSSVTVVNLIYTQLELQLEGFGYLVPSQYQKHGILGVIYDSALFKEHDPKMDSERRVRLSVMLGGESINHTSCASEKMSHAIDHLKESLNITHPPVYQHSYEWKDAIPIYAPNHAKKINLITDKLSILTNNSFLCVGSSYYGVSLNDIAHFTIQKVASLKL